MGFEAISISVGLLKTGFGDCIFFCTTRAHMQYAIPEASFEKWLLRPTLIWYT